MFARNLAAATRRVVSQNTASRRTILSAARTQASSSSSAMTMGALLAAGLLTYNLNQKEEHLVSSGWNHGPDLPFRKERTNAVARARSRLESVFTDFSPFGSHNSSSSRHLSLYIYTKTRHKTSLVRNLSNKSKKSLEPIGLAIFLFCLVHRERARERTDPKLKTCWAFHSFPLETCSGPLLPTKPKLERKRKPS